MEEYPNEVDDYGREDWLDEYERDLAGCVPGN